MKSQFFGPVSLMALFVLVLMGALPSLALAAAKSTPSTVQTPTAPQAPASPDVPTVAVTAPVATTPVAPTPAAQAAATATQAAKTPPLPTTLTFGNLTYTHMAAAPKNGHVDLYVTIKNNGTADDKMIGAGSSTIDIGDVVIVKKDKDGKEQEEAISEVIPAGKSVEFGEGSMWFRVKSIQTKPVPPLLPISFYYRSSPNANLKFDMNGKGEGSSVLDWFKK